MQTEPSTGVLRQIPRSVWVLGCVSLLMDVSSEIIHSLLPMFLMAGNRRERDRDRRHRGDRRGDGAGRQGVLRHAE